MNAISSWIRHPRRVVHRGTLAFCGTQAGTTRTMVRDGGPDHRLPSLGRRGQPAVGEVGRRSEEERTGASVAGRDDRCHRVGTRRSHQANGSTTFTPLCSKSPMLRVARVSVWTLAPGDAHYSTRWSLIEGYFSRAIEKGERVSRSRAKLGERGLWQRRF